MGEIIKFTGESTLDSDPDQVLAEALGEYTQVLVIGFNRNEEFDYRASTSNIGDILYLLELAKKHALEDEDEDKKEE